jgi:nucleotide-binding universal stress UspA family protein
MALTSVLAPVDFSEDSAQGARLAAMIARRHGARLSLLHVDGLPVYTKQVANAAAPAVWIEYLEQRDQALQQRLGEFAERLEIETDSELSLARGDAAKAIQQHAQAGRHDLVVISPRGRGYGHQFLVGSVSAAVASAAPCPVLVARTRADGALWRGEFARPLLAVSDQQFAEGALAVTLALAEKGTTIDLVHVLEGCEITLGPPLPGAFHAALQQRREELRDELLRLAEPALLEGFVASVQVETGDPSFSMLCRVENKRNELVVVSRKPTGNDRGYLANTAYRMVKHSPVPVLVVP